MESIHAPVTGRNAMTKLPLKDFSMAKATEMRLMRFIKYDN
ncbi:MAG: hypothetical protein ABI415_05445 [Flavitalea sp.]